MGPLKWLHNTDKLFAVILIAFAAVMYVIIGGMEEPYMPGALAASTYPRLVLICMIITACLIIIRPGPGTTDVTRPVSLKSISVIALTVFYIGFIEIAGFFILTPVFLMLLPVMAGFKRHGMTIISAILVTAMLYGIFVGVLNIPLPAGILGD